MVLRNLVEKNSTFSEHKSKEEDIIFEKKLIKKEQRNMASFSENMLNMSVVNTSAIHGDDFDMFLDCLEELYKNKGTDDDKKRKSRKTKRSKNGKMPKQKDTQAGVDDTFQPVVSHDNLEESVINSTHSTMDTSQWSPNDTLLTVNSEQLNNIFAYFEQDVATDEFLSDDLPDNHENNSDELTSNFTNLKIATDHGDNVSSSEEPVEKEQIPAEDAVRTKNHSILDKINQFNHVEPPTNFGAKALHRVKAKPSADTESHRLSSASTSSVHDSNIDLTFKKPKDVIDAGTVKRKVVFFSDPIVTELRSPSIHSLSQSEDEDYEFKRTQSKRQFHKNRDFFENYFKSKTDAVSVKSTQSAPTGSFDRQTKHQFAAHSEQNLCKQTENHCSDIDPNEKLQAVQTYVQTKYLLERIQRLVAAISSLDEKRLSTMNLKLLKKFLTYIRDCSYNCTDVCDKISEHFLTDFERNVMSAEDLLISALRVAQCQQV